MHIAEIIKHLPPLHRELKLVSRNFYRSIELTQNNVGYWRSRPDAPRRLLSSGEAYVIYFNTQANLDNYFSHGNWSYDRRYFSPSAFAEAFPVFWSNLPIETYSYAPDTYYELYHDKKSVGVVVIKSVYSFIGKLVRCGKTYADIAPYANVIASYHYANDNISTDYMHHTAVSDIITGLKKYRDVEIYDWARSIPIALLGYGLEGNVNYNLDYYAWLQSLGYPYEDIVNTVRNTKSRLRYAEKGANLDLPFVEEVLLELPMSSRSVITLPDVISGYLFLETDLDSAVERLKRWGFVGAWQYRILETLAGNNYPLIKRLLDDLPRAKPKGYGATDVKHIRTTLHKLEGDPNLRGYPALTHQLELWKPR